MAAAKVAPREIQFDGVLPRWPEDDPEFLRHLLRTSYGRKLVTIADIVRDLGLPVDREDDASQRSREYQRLRRAMHTLLAAGSVRRSGKMWGLP